MSDNATKTDGAMEELTRRMEETVRATTGTSSPHDDAIDALKAQVAKVEEEMRSEKERKAEGQRKGEQAAEERTKEG